MSPKKKATVTKGTVTSSLLDELVQIRDLYASRENEIADLRRSLKEAEDELKKRRQRDAEVSEWLAERPHDALSGADVMWLSYNQGSIQCRLRLSGQLKWVVKAAGRRMGMAPSLREAMDEAWKKRGIRGLDAAGSEAAIEEGAELGDGD